MSHVTPNLLALLPRLSGKRVLVVGDVCLDEYIIGKAQRLSREAPVPVLELQERLVVPGAACNPALNIQAVGGTALIAGVVGEDESGRQLCQAVEAAGIPTDGLVASSLRETTVKTRVLASHLFPQQVVRIDRQNRTALDPRCRRALRRFLGMAAPNMDAVLISDYQSGVVDAGLVRYIRGLAASSGAPLCVDSQGDFGKFKGVSLLRCNREEAERFLGRPLQDERAMEQAGLALKKQLGVGAVVITRGSQGLSMVDAEGVAGHVAVSNPSEVYDVTGAGDTVIALLTLALSAGAPLAHGAALANIAAGLVVRKLGNATVSAEELAEAVRAAP